jgi:hypothetical protein
MMNADVFMVNQWVISQRSGGLGLLSGTAIRPSFYVFPLYKNFGSQQVYSASGIADVDIFAARRTDGALTLMVINLADEARTAPLLIKGMTVKEAEVWRLDITHNSENLGIQTIPADGALTVPAQSVSLFILK